MTIQKNSEFIRAYPELKAPLPCLESVVLEGVLFEVGKTYCRNDHQMVMFDGGKFVYISEPWLITEIYLSETNCYLVVLHKEAIGLISLDLQTLRMNAKLQNKYMLKNMIECLS